MFNPFKRKPANTGYLPAEEAADKDQARRPRRDFKVLYPREMRIQVLVTSNPKRKDSQAAFRFDLYRDGMSIGEALDVGILYKDIDYDWESSFISLDGRVFGE